MTNVLFVIVRLCNCIVRFRVDVAEVPTDETSKQIPASVSSAICETLLDMSRCAWVLGSYDFLFLSVSPKSRLISLFDRSP